MTLSLQCVTHITGSPARSPVGTSRVRPRAGALLISALGIVLGCALCVPSVQAQSSPALSGNWKLSCTGRGGRVRQISLQIEQQGAKLSGSFSAGRRSGRLSGSVQGKEVSLELAGARREATLTGTTDGNTLQVHAAKGASCAAERQ